MFPQKLLLQKFGNKKGYAIISLTNQVNISLARY